MKHKPTFTQFPQKLLSLMVITIALCTLSASCDTPPDSTVEGLFSTSFEASVFYPCNTSTPKEYIEGDGNKDIVYWLTSTLDSGFNEQLEAFNSQREPTGALNLYIKFVGSISPTKKHGYGHLNMYSNQITVIEVIDIKPWNDSQCVVVR